MLGSFVGYSRQLSNVSRGRIDRAECPKEGAWDVHVQGALAELALAKIINCFWSGNFDQLNKADVGAIEVRSTPLEHGCLLLREKDSSEAVFVLCVGRDANWRAVGWLPGIEGKIRGYWREPNNRPGCYMIPQTALYPMADLVDKLGKRP